MPASSIASTTAGLTVSAETAPADFHPLPGKVREEGSSHLRAPSVMDTDEHAGRPLLRSERLLHQRRDSGRSHHRRQSSQDNIRLRLPGLVRTRLSPLPIKEGAQKFAEGVLRQPTGSNPFHFGEDPWRALRRRQRRSERVPHLAWPPLQSSECAQRCDHLLLCDLHHGLGDPPQRLAHSRPPRFSW